MNKSEKSFKAIKEHTHLSLLSTLIYEAYSFLENEGYNHKTVNHSLYFVDQLTGVYINKIEGLLEWYYNANNPRKPTKKFKVVYLNLYEEKSTKMNFGR